MLQRSSQCPISFHFQGNNCLQEQGQSYHVSCEIQLEVDCSRCYLETGKRSLDICTTSNTEEIDSLHAHGEVSLAELYDMQPD